jgi:hypothetical protein
MRHLLTYMVVLLAGIEYRATAQPNTEATSAVILDANGNQALGKK